MYVWLCMHSYQTLNALNPCFLTKGKQRDTRDALTPFNFGPPTFRPHACVLIMSFLSSHFYIYQMFE